MAKEIVSTKVAPKPIGPYSQGVVAGGFLFTSGQIGMDPDTGEFISCEVSEQTKQALENIAGILKSRGLSLGDVVRVCIYLPDLSDFPEMNRVYEEFFRVDPPARTTVGVSSLPKGARVEIEAIAVFGV